jgi:aspartyl-tRNA(Asn)/glutamyl-tRNA(Gln) amidotransferase subunit C
MATPDLNVKYIAHLARLQLTPAEEQTIGRQLGHILEHIEKLKELNVGAVEPTAHAVPLVNVVRADEVSESLPHDDAMKNAPAKRDGLFIVPKIVE